jgi:hypothetical protein
MTNGRGVPEGRWRLVCSPRTFAELRTDPEFTFLVTLARYVNALKYGMAVMNAQGDSTAPAADRQRHGSFVYVAGVLHELLGFLDDAATEKKKKLGLAGLTAFVEVKRAIDRVRLTKQQRELLEYVRNRGAFHVNPQIAARVLPHLPEMELTFAAGDGRRPLGVNAEFSELVTFLYMFRRGAGGARGRRQEVVQASDLQDLSSIQRRFEELYAVMRDLAAAFVDAADRQLFRRLLARGFRFAPGTEEGGEQPART